MKKKNLKSVFLTTLLLLVPAIISGCALADKLKASQIIVDTKFNFKEMGYNRVEVNSDIMELVQNGLKGFLPNPKAVALVKDLSQGIVKTDLGKAFFDVRLNANNTSKDTLWINDFHIEIQFDTLVTLPLQLADTMTLAPGDNDLNLVVTFPLDMHLFKLNEVQKYVIAGEINVALQKGGKSIKQTIAIERDASKDAKALEELVRNRLFELLVNDWLGSVVK